MADPIDYSQGTYSDQGVQDLLKTLLPNWNTQWQDPNMAGGYVMPGGSNYTLGTAESNVNSALTQFTQQVQAVTGQPPTQDQINTFFNNVLVPMASQAQPGGYNPLNPTNIQAAIQNYVPNAFAQQIQQFGQTNQTNALNKNLATGESLIDQSTGTFAKNLTDPNNAMYQGFSGNLNNLGITPQSGAFQAGLGSTIANENQQLQSQLMASLGFPSLSAIQGLSGVPTTNLNNAQPTAQSTLTGQTQGLNNFQLQADLAQQLQALGQPSGLQNAFGMAAGAGQAIGGIGQGIGGASQITWICTAMVRHGVMTKNEVNKLHNHLFKALWKRPLKFLGYLLFGKFLVWLAESKGIDWKVWKPCFYDEPMRENDPVKAVDLYEQSFWDLYRVKSQKREVCHG